MMTSSGHESTKTQRLTYSLCLCVLVASLVGATVWLAIRQQRLERRIESLQVENTRLSEELTQKPNLSPAQFRDASQQLEKAGAFIDAVENRLTNASALLGQLQAASQNFTGPGRRAVIGNQVPPRPVY